MMTLKMDTHIGVYTVCLVCVVLEKVFDIQMELIMNSTVQYSEFTCHLLFRILLLLTACFSPCH
jgi:hypothetical protein